MENTRNLQQDQVLDAKEVAEILKVHEKTVRNMAQAKKLPGIRIGKSWRFSANAIYKLLPQS